MPTKPQISKIFASARELGWDRDQLNELVIQVSGGDSISSLTIEQAGAVIELLVKAGASAGRRGKTSGRRTADNEVLLITPGQRDLIEDLREQIGGDWLRDPYFEGACKRLIRKARPSTAGNATRIIEMLKQRLAHANRKAQ